MTFKPRRGYARIVLALLLLSSWCLANGGEGAKLLDRIVKDPGSWTQMCMMSPPVPASEIPVGGYVRLWTSTKISDANFKLLRAHRSEVLDELSRRLPGCKELAIKCTQTEIGRAQGKKLVWPDEDNKLEAYMMVLQDLNGIEALPTLLRLEVPVNKLALYDVLAKRPDPKWLTYPVHVQILSTITAILKNEGVKGAEQLGEHTVYDKAHRDQIVKMATDYLKSTKPSAYKGAKGMEPVPHPR